MGWFIQPIFAAAFGIPGLQLPTVARLQYCLTDRVEFSRFTQLNKSQWSYKMGKKFYMKLLRYRNYFEHYLTVISIDLQIQ